MQCPIEKTAVSKLFMEYSVINASLENKFDKQNNFLFCQIP